MNSQITSYTYSVVLSIYNEEACLKEVLSRLAQTLINMGQGYEIICVDDGSKDKTWDIINQCRKENSCIKGLKLSRNFGHQIAIYAGIKACSGDYVAVLDADGQDPPELLQEMFNKCRQGYDVVYAIRKKRKENIFKRLAYKLFYRFYRSIVPFDAPLDAGDFSVFNTKVADFIRTLNEKTPFIRGLRSWYGGKQTGIEFEREKRFSGKPKYSLIRLVLLATNACVSFSKLPLRIISVAGIVISCLAFIGGAALLIMKLTIGIPLIGWTSVILTIIFFGGINLFVLGVIGEYIGNIFDEVKNRPPFTIEESLGIDK